MSTPLLLVGCGKMGSALLAGWLDRGLGRDGIVVIEPQSMSMKDFARRDGVRHVAELAALPADLDPSTVLLAVKPQTMDEVLAPLRRYARATFLSIAAGKTLAYFQKGLGDVAVVRSMPNTPAAIGRGVTVAIANSRVAASSRARCHDLLAAVGDVEWVDDEDLLDAVTALSGGGPAYVFLLMEVLAAAGAKAGLPAELATRLARTTVSGAGELARRSDRPAAQLRQDVTSPGGTTLEALKILMATDGLQPVFDRAIAAATRRSKELAG
jgi:pyrroline-5-carboxylate reductase